MSFVETAYNKGLRARASPTDALLLRDGARHRILVDSAGSLTKFGREYEGLSGESLPIMFFFVYFLTVYKSGSAYHIRLSSDISFQDQQIDNFEGVETIRFTCLAALLQHSRTLFAESQG